MAATSGFVAEVAAVGTCFALVSQTTAVFISLLTVCVAALLVATGFLLAVVSLRRAEANVAAGDADRDLEAQPLASPRVRPNEAGASGAGADAKDPPPTWSASRRVMRPVTWASITPRTQGRSADEIHRDLGGEISPQRIPLGMRSRAATVELARSQSPGRVVRISPEPPLAAPPPRPSSRSPSRRKDICLTSMAEDSPGLGDEDGRGAAEAGDWPSGRSRHSPRRDGADGDGQKDGHKEGECLSRHRSRHRDRERDRVRDRDKDRERDKDRARQGKHFHSNSESHGDGSHGRRQGSRTRSVGGAVVLATFSRRRHEDAAEGESAPKVKHSVSRSGSRGRGAATLEEGIGALDALAGGAAQPRRR